MTALVHFQRLKKICAKVCLKELYLVKQSLYKLESRKRDFNLKETEIALHSPAVGSLITLRSPSTNSFFNLAFSLLLNLLSFNTP